MNTIEKFNNWISTSVTVKMFSVGVLILLLLIPKSMITSLIRERETRMDEAATEITVMWPGSQKIVGPIITIPYNSYYKEKEEVKISVEYAHFLPEKLNIKSEIIPEERNLGIYRVVVYKSKVSMDGVFNQPDFSQWDINEEDIHWDKARISLGFSDLRAWKRASI